MAICWWEIVQFHSVIIDDFFMLSAGDPYLLCAHLDVVPTGERERSSYHCSPSDTSLERKTLKIEISLRPATTPENPPRPAGFSGRSEGYLAENPRGLRDAVLRWGWTKRLFPFIRWLEDPFLGDVINQDGEDYIFGRGAIDDKHSVVGFCLQRKLQSLTVASRWEFFRPWRLSYQTKGNQKGRCMWLLDMMKRFCFWIHFHFVFCI